MTFMSIKVMVHRHGYVTFASHLERRVNTVHDLYALEGWNIVIESSVCLSVCPSDFVSAL